VSAEAARRGAARLEPGSFRDADSTVLYTDERVFRALSPAGLVSFEALERSRLFERFGGDGRLVGTRRADGAADVPALRTEEVAALLEHERVPFVSYPYEWPFGMLRDAALLQLDLLLAALDEDLILKDSSPYNVMWRGARPTFVDVGSFERLPEGEPWIGYRQFCMLFLYPLMLQAYKGLPPQAWLRGAIDGIPPADMSAVMSARDVIRRGVLTHVRLHARLERRHGERPREVKRELSRAGFNKKLIRANVSKLRKLVTRLDWTPPKGVWTEYGERSHYSDRDTEEKDRFVREVAGSRRWPLVWDLGCNDGRHARIASAAGADYVVAMDGNQGPVELLYRTLRDEGVTDIHPLTVNLTDPSPALGWRGAERKTLLERGRPDLVLCLALVHHVSIAGNVPVREVVDWLRSLDATLVVEFPTREDPKVEQLLAAKRPGTHLDYEREFFERCLGERFEVERSQRLPSGTRVLYLARPRGTSAGDANGRTALAG
jgi:hypothetical protein